ncbi:MAG: thiamine-phosphate kinase [Rhodospirillaceae bacterium]|jgi:thiamine-monophosphate kinase|nr:thiamine-phosphate kinase [Rhodospirillaceae bacterium]MBT5943078.1 thiamine-phosphate kinase [Rhodospirillaceae bacterium]MBT6405347.1 thiamine-phosphate kinase [Rhodospirillaceae bacterium]MBT7360804.1 thiamine-phosphate kinase [Rhodospirillaceae bacterium]
MARGIDEFDLIRRYFEPLSNGEPGALGLRDDAAWLRPDPGTEIIVSADAIVAGVHFPTSTMPGDVARRALRVNLSDIAAKGAQARCYTLTLQLPDTVDEEWLAAFAAGLAGDHETYGVSLLGGDTTRTSGPLSLSINIFGQIAENSMIKRSSAGAEDDVYVSGTIGDACLGLGSIVGGLAVDDAADRAFLEGRFWRPDPRVSLGPALVGVATASADVSDGLVADLGHICAASDVAAEIHQHLVPISDAARRLVTDNQPLRTNLMTGGDDYEIVFTAPVSARETIVSIASQIGVSITRIGCTIPVTSGATAVTVHDEAGDIVEVGVGGYRHFGEHVAG